MNDPSNRTGHNPGKSRQNRGGNESKQIRKSGTYYSRGKLLLTGEYLVLHGANALALPLKLGQKLEYKKENDDGLKTLKWTTTVRGEKKFEAVFRGDDYMIDEASDNGKAGYLRHILMNASELSDFAPAFGKVGSSIEFDMEWGFGSSSSLISNIAYMFDINPYTLHFSVSKGSGYDIACARAKTPILYRLDYQTDSYESKKVTAREEESFPVSVCSSAGFDPPFGNKLFFAYTGKKQDSAVSVEKFLSAKNSTDFHIDRVSAISREIIRTSDIESFNDLLREHDSILSLLLGRKPASKAMFPGFPGYIKYLGAWGGDFVLISWPGDVDELMKLLKQKGVEIVFPYKKLVYNED